MKKTFLKGLVEKAEDNGIISVSVATDISQDRDGEVVNPDGLDLKNFLANPVLLWAHDYRNPPIGKVIEIIKEGNRVLFKSQFAIDVSEQARQIYGLFKGGFLNAFSIGFMPLEKEGNIYTKAELLEISAVPVPSNPNALVLARSAGDIDAKVIDEVEQLNKDAEETASNTEKIDTMQKEITNLKSEIEVLQKSVPPLNEADGRNGEPLPRSKKNIGVPVADVKRILQTVNRATAEGLRDLRRLKQ